MPVGYHLKLRCFLEGIEVPIIAASMSINADAPAQCQIQIPATDKAYKFLPRTLVHVFFYDYALGPSDTINVTIGDPTQVSTSDEQADQMIHNETSGDVSQSVQELEEEFDTSSILSADIPEEEYEQLTGVSLGQSPVDLPSTGADEQAGPTHASQTSGSEEEEAPEDVPISDQRWKLFFSGEVMGYQFTKSMNQRAIILTCSDLSIYWDTCYQYKVNVASLHGNGMAHFVGAGTTMFDTFFESSVSTIVDVINRPSKSRPDLTGLLSGVVHLLERVGGVYTSNGFRGVNDFFSIAELRLHLIDMLSAAESDSSSQRLFPRRAFSRWSRSEGGRLGKIASFREMLNMINKFIFHNTFPCPIAKYDEPLSYERSRTRRGSTTTRFLDTPHGVELAAAANRHYNTALALRSQGQQILERGARLSNRLPGFADSIRNTKDRLLPYRDRFSLQETYRSLHRAGRYALAWARDLEVYERHSEQQQRQTYDDFYQHGATENTDQCLAELRSVVIALAGSSVTRSHTRTEVENVAVAGRLHSQIIRPDIFMVSPPRCNVLFPEVYSSLQFSRQFMKEVTRMRLTVSDEIFGSDALLDNVYYAPDVEVLGERVRQGEGGSFEGATLDRAAYTRRLMDHELFTGVVPVFERLNEVNLAAARTNLVTYRGARVPYAARAANFQFFKHRFAPRSMQVSGRFNPWAVAGFPAVVIDRHMTAPQLRLSSLRGTDLLEQAVSQNIPGITEEVGDQGFDYSSLDAWMALREAVPTQFVGLISGMQHNVSQTAAATSYTLTTARTHREREELLGADQVQVDRRNVGQRAVDSTVAALESSPPQPGQLGPKYGLITNVSQVSRRGRFQLFGTFGGDRPRTQRVYVDVGIAQTARAFGPEVITLVGDPNQEVTFQAYTITEQVDRWRRERVDLPIEDFLRPPWMSDVWTNARIGAVYQQFFGVGSITDPITISTGTSSFSPTSDASLQQSEAEARSLAEQDPLSTASFTEQNAGMDITVERAIDLLVRSYSSLKHAGMDVNEFIKAYTYRPVANIQQILGSRDLRIHPTTGQKLSGTEGLHSRAFGHGLLGMNLRNLVPPDSHQERLLGIGTRDGQDRYNLLSRLDKRAEKAAAVLEYVNELWNSRGQLG